MEHRITNPMPPNGDPRTPSRRLLTLAEVARFLAVSPHTVRRLRSNGSLPVVRFCRRLLFDLKDLERFVEQSRDRSGTGV